MGNYYHGELQINIEPKTLKFSDCFDLIEEFAHLCFENKSDLFIEITDENGVVFDRFNSFKGIFIDKNAQISQKLVYRDLLIQYNKDVDDDYAECIYDDEDVKFFERIKNDEIDYENIAVDQIEISCNTKYFKEYNDEEKIIKIIERFRLFKSKDSENRIGSISDEDQTYYKSFWWDVDALNAEIKSREYLCEGCEYHKFREELCSRFEICERAFKLGKQLAINNSNDNM